MLKDNAKCDESDRIPRRAERRYKPKKQTEEKVYELSGLSEDQSSCKKRFDCQCAVFFSSFANAQTYDSWKQRIYQQYQELSKAEKLQYLQQWIHFKMPRVQSKGKHSNKPVRSSDYYIFRDYLGFTQRLCRPVFCNLFNIGQNHAIRNHLKFIWKHRISDDLQIDTKEYARRNVQSAEWIDHFENWLLKSIPFQWSHYGVREIPYLSIQPVDGKTLLPKDLYVYLCFISRICSHFRQHQIRIMDEGMATKYVRIMGKIYTSTSL